MAEGDEFEEDAAERPHVRLEGVGLVPEQFRRHVVGRAAHAAARRRGGECGQRGPRVRDETRGAVPDDGAGHLKGALEHLGDSEVAQLDHVVLG